MGQVNWIHDESYRAAQLVVRHFEARLDDAEILERHEREFHRLAKKGTTEPCPNP